MGKKRIEVGLKAILPNWATQRGVRPPAESVCVYNHKTPKGCRSEMEVAYQTRASTTSQELQSEVPDCGGS